MAAPDKKASATTDIEALRKMIEGVLDDMVLHHGVDSAGTIFGFEDYENLDPGWLEYITGWLRHAPSLGRGTAPGQEGQHVQIPDDTRIAVVGDWGTGTRYSTQTAGCVAAAMKGCEPDYSIHLGDVYYAGKPDQQVKNFLDPWRDGAQGSVGSFTLNSNHDMYAGAVGYNETLSDPMFTLQNRQGHFVLENTNWVVVGLDTAWPASWDDQYMFGALDERQLDFLREQAATGKKLILLTHHQGLMQQSGLANQPLHDNVVAAVDQARYGSRPWYWYWGHIHAGYVHTPAAAPYLGRCNGHGAIPWGLARELEPLTKGSDAKVGWFEQTTNPVGHHRVMNGFAMLHLDDAVLTESFLDQDGNTSWTPQDAPG